jgi:hypothetical protein
LTQKRGFIFPKCLLTSIRYQRRTIPLVWESIERRRVRFVFESFYDEELSAIGQYSRRSLCAPMKIKFSARETKRSTGRLPRRPAESVPHRNTLGGGERGSLATRVRRTLRRASRTTSSHPPRGARTARRFSQHHSRDNSGPHAGVRLDGTPKTRAHPPFRGRERSLF